MIDPLGAPSPPSAVHPTQPAVLALENVTSGYRRSAVLRDVSLHVPAGTVVALLGPNGAGKTTLLRTASGIIRPTAGQVWLDGSDVTGLGVHARARRGLCDIPEGRGIFPSLTVRENLLLQSPRGREHESIALACDAFPPLAPRLDRLAGSLSGGEQQMLAVSRAYLTDPRVVLVDEVSLGLAPLVIDRIFERLSAIAAQGTALLLVEQYVTRALDLADHVYLLNRGSMVFSGSSSALRGEDIFERYLNIDVGAV